MVCGLLLSISTAVGVSSGGRFFDGPRFGICWVRNIRLLIISKSHYFEESERIDVIRSWAFEMANMIEECINDSRERSLALTHLEETLMWASKAIVLGDATITR